MKVYLVTEADLDRLQERFAANCSSQIAKVLGKSKEEFPTKEAFKAASGEIRELFMADMRDWIYGVTERKSV